MDVPHTGGGGFVDQGRSVAFERVETFRFIDFTDFKSQMVRDRRHPEFQINGHGFSDSGNGAEGLDGPKRSEPNERKHHALVRPTRNPMQESAEAGIVHVAQVMRVVGAINAGEPVTEDVGPQAVEHAGLKHVQRGLEGDLIKLRQVDIASAIENPKADGQLENFMITLPLPLRILGADAIRCQIEFLLPRDGGKFLLGSAIGDPERVCRGGCLPPFEHAHDVPGGLMSDEDVRGFSHEMNL